MFLADLTWQSLRWLPIAIVALGAGIAATWWMYAPQVRVRSPGVRWGLPVLRSLVLVALAVALIKPVVLRARSEAERGTVLVLIDQSASMNVVDASRSAAQLIAMADGLKLLPGGISKDLSPVTSDDVEQLRSQADRIARASSELDYARLADRGVEAAQTRLDEAVAQLSAQAQAMIDRSQDKSKKNRVHERLAALLSTSAKDRDTFLRELPGRVDRLAATAADAEGGAAEQLYRGSAEVKAACDRLASLSRAELAKLAVRQAMDVPEKGWPIAVFGFAADVSPMTLTAGPTTQPATGPTTRSAGENTSDLTGAIRQAIRKYPRGGVRAVVLVSDGRQIGGEANVEAMAAGINGVPVHTVRVAPAQSPKDVAIVRTVIPGRAFAGETVTVRIDLRSTGIRGEVPVKLQSGSIVQTKNVRFNDDNGASAEFSLKLDQAGVASVTVSVAGQTGEVSVANNTVERRISVLHDKVRVLAIAQSAGRDFQFLRDALERTPWVQLDESIANAPDDTVAPKPTTITGADLIILEDAGTGLLSRADWSEVRKLVSERGAGAILLAGDANDPALLLTQPDAAVLLPFADPAAVKWRQWAGEWPSLRAVPNREGGDRTRLPDALRLTEDLDSSLRRWQELPAMFRLMAITPLKPNTSALLVDAETKSPVLTESRLGAGRVLFVGMNETWRWRYKIGQRDQDRFWLQLVRQVADEPFAATAGGVSIDADRVQVEPNRPIKLRVRLRDENGRASDAPRVTITARDADGGTRLETLNATTPGSGRYEKTITTWPTGEYQLTVNDTVEPKLAVRVVATGEAEMALLAGDERFLQRIAAATGGQSYLPERLSDLPAHLSAQAAANPQMAEVRLWDSPYLFAFVLACLGLEWAVRKQAGLA